MSYRVLITDHPWAGTEIEEQILSPHRIAVVDAPSGDEATLMRMAEDADAIATCWAEVTANVIKAATKCRVICRLGIGLDNIDVAAASSRRIPVTNVPDYCVEEVADHTLGLILAATRNIAQQHLQTKQGVYDLQSAPPLLRTRGQRLGLIGLGCIGRAVFNRAVSFGLNVVASTPSGNSYGSGCPMVSLDELLATSDIISLHAPLTPTSQHIINTAAFQQMKRGVTIVNTSRGGLIDEAALWSAIEAGVVAHAGLDVFSPEPPDLSQPLFQDKRVIVTPHTAFVSEESLVELRQRVAQTVVDVLAGTPVENVVNATALKLPTSLTRDDSKSDHG